MSRKMFDEFDYKPYYDEMGDEVEPKFNAAHDVIHGSEFKYASSKISELSRRIHAETSEIYRVAHALEAVGLDKLAHKLFGVVKAQRDMADAIPGLCIDWTRGEIDHGRTIMAGLMGVVIEHGPAIAESQAKKAAQKQQQN